jgi:hypothetical protein
MPLRDHFRPPINTRHSWEGFHGQWPGMIVQRLVPDLPENYIAEPRVHLGTYFEIDVARYESDSPAGTAPSPNVPGNGPVATAVRAMPQPTLTIETDLSEQYEYEVRVYDQTRNRRLVAAVELVSPANKDRPEARRVFVAKTAAHLQQGVCVSIVDLISARHFNMYADLLTLIGRSDPSLGENPSHLYAATCRNRRADGRGLVDTWLYPLTIGEPLPKLPLWLTEDFGLLLDLEASYEDTCRALRIR